MAHAGASTSCHLLSALRVHPKYLLMTAYNGMAKYFLLRGCSFSPTRYIDAQVCRCDSVAVALRSFLNYDFIVLARIVSLRKCVAISTLSLSLSYLIYFYYLM